MRRILPVIILLMLLLAGCFHDKEPPKEYVPQMTVTIDPSSVTVKSDELSQIIIVTLKKEDDVRIPAKFNIILKTPNALEVAFYDVSGQQISTIETQNYTIKGDQNSHSIRVKGKRLGASSYTPYTLSLQLEYKGKLIGQLQRLNVNIN